MKKLMITVIALVISSLALLNAQSKQTQKEQFQATYNNSKTLVETQHYKFIATWVFSDKKREAITSDSNNVTINKSNISGQLAVLGNKEDIDLKSLMTNYLVSFDDENQHISINFNIKSYAINIEIKENGHAFLFLVSDKGNEITYRGKIVEM